MEFITLNNGVKMPAEGIGTFLLTPDEAETAVLSALKDGARLIDTANAYCNEKAVGRAMKKSGLLREEIFLETKLWPSFYTDADAVDKTLARLDTDYIDLLLIHQPAGDYVAGYRLMEKAYKEGKVRAIGLSNFNEEQIKEILSMRSVIFAVSTALTVLLSACTGAASSVPVNTVSSVSASTSITTSSEVDSAVSESASSETGNIQTGLVREQTLDSTEGLIHYSYYLPEDYDPTRKYPMMVVMPGYNMMWFGESSSGSNLDWTGFTSWTNLGQDMIVVSAQLTDWGDTSARQAIALTEYFINHFAVDTARIYATGYSAGGETMSRAVAMRPDLYAAYLHRASQWDGGFAPIAENGVAVYIYMAQGDEYYGVQKARDAYNGLHDAYAAAGWTDEQIDTVLQMQTPDNAFFDAQGLHVYHAAANVVFDDADILNWIVSKHK